VTDALVLCGGKGTRAYPHTVDVPKPLLHVDGRPVLHHLLGIYARQGFTRFVLAAGYKCELIEQFAAGLPAEWTVEVVDTGVETNTAGRIRACRDRVGERFFANYADGLADVDLRALLGCHAAHGRAATLTTVPLPSQYGTLETDEAGVVRRFREKPRLPDHRINAGFFVLEQRALDLAAGDDLERDVLPGLAASGELVAFRHDGFWRSMDTYKDALELTALCEAGHPPWEGASQEQRPVAQ
jgi:glucose-1-phosphate cytidylyltransferase